MIWAILQCGHWNGMVDIWQSMIIHFKCKETTILCAKYTSNYSCLKFKRKNTDWQVLTYFQKRLQTSTKTSDMNLLNTQT